MLTTINIIGSAWIIDGFNGNNHYRPLSYFRGKIGVMLNSTQYSIIVLRNITVSTDADLSLLFNILYMANCKVFDLVDLWFDDWYSLARLAGVWAWSRKATKRGVISILRYGRTYHSITQLMSDIVITAADVKMQ